MIRSMTAFARVSLAAGGKHWVVEIKSLNQRYFEHEGFQFHDSWEWDNTSYTFRFLWCLYAITWGIRQYDAATTPAQAEA